MNHELVKVAISLGGGLVTFLVLNGWHGMTHAIARISPTPDNKAASRKEFTKELILAGINTVLAYALLGMDGVK